MTPRKLSNELKKAGILIDKDTLKKLPEDERSKLASKNLFRSLDFSARACYHYSRKVA